MKRTITFVLLSAALFTYSGKSHAQFLKKLGKSIDNVLGTEEVTNTSGTEANSSKITITTPHRNLKVNVLSAISNGDEFLLEFTITNVGEDIKGYYLMDGSSGKTIAFDNLGNQCYETILFGNVRSKNNGYAENTLINGVPVKVVVTITKFGTNATSFSQIKIGAGTDIWKIANHFVFKNVPIIKNEETEVVIPVKRTDIPIEEKNVSELIEEKPVSQKVEYEQKEVLPLNNVIKFSSFPKTVEYRELSDLGYWKVMGITCIKANRFKIIVKGLKDSRQLTPGQCSLSIDQATKGSFGIKKAYTGAYNFPRIQEGEVREFEIVTAAPHSEFAGFVIYRSKMGSPYEILNPYDSRWGVVSGSTIKKNIIATIPSI